MLPLLLDGAVLVLWKLACDQPCTDVVQCSHKNTERHRCKVASKQCKVGVACTNAKILNQRPKHESIHVLLAVALVNTRHRHRPYIVQVNLAPRLVYIHVAPAIVDHHLVYVSTPVAEVVYKHDFLDERAEHVNANSTDKLVTEEN